MFVAFKAILFQISVANNPGQKQEDDTLVTNNNKNFVSHAVKTATTISHLRVRAKSEFKGLYWNSQTPFKVAQTGRLSGFLQQYWSHSMHFLCAEVLVTVCLQILHFLC